ncbi:uncharacterized protein LOC144654075 [Oculina patagonica]
MATSIQNDVVAAVENEISCPVCLDDFEEPKCLPNCAHNVCQHCLEGMVKKRQSSIECPVCRIESVIPNGGVAAFPKNHLLVRLIERTPGRKEKEAIKEALKTCKGKLESAEAALKEMENRYVTSRSQAEEIKEKIKSMAENVVTKVREQETKMLSEIDQKLSQNRNQGTFETHKSNTSELCENASSCIRTVEDILQNGEPSDLKDLKEALIEELSEFSESLESRVFWANCEFTHPFEVSLTNTDIVDRFVDEECMLGKLTINTGSESSTEGAECIPTVSVFSGFCKATPVVQKSIDYSRSGSLIQTINNSSIGVAKFIPFSVAVSRNSGHFVALDEEMKHVHIFNEEGEPLKKFRIMYGDLWDIGVSNENEIVVLNRESNRVLHYDMNGNFKKKFVTAPKDNVKFTSLSVDIHGRFIISSSPCYSETREDTMPCILVYNPSGKLTMSFGDDRLLAPEKAVFLNGKFFVVDNGHKCIVVFDKNGDFLEEIGRGCQDHPCSIAADFTNGNLVVCNRGNSTIQIYSQDGCLLHRFGTEHIPLQVAFTKNYKNLLICFEIDDGKKNIQMMTYS